ncbi:hypothetical protein PI125_g16123 [Phytophthora idaei]|nr:hypothetical protein PI125_g16123 [Phytophthora idaei]
MRAELVCGRFVGQRSGCTRGWSRRRRHRCEDVPGPPKVGSCDWSPIDTDDDIVLVGEPGDEDCVPVKRDDEIGAMERM